MFRTTIFWLHFACGVAVGLVVLMMSVTGVILTYERQILAWEFRSHHAITDPGNDRLPVEQLAAAVEREGGFAPSSITIFNDEAVPVLAREGRSHSRYVNPWTAELLPPYESRLESFFSTITRWHRWFDAGGDNRDAARLVTGVSNLVFLVMILTGLYLWLPKIFKYRTFRNRFWFTRNRNSAARDFNWHHVLGLWSAIPLIVIVASGAVFGFGWANDLVYRLAGEEPPQRGRPRTSDAADPSPGRIAPTRFVSLDAIVQRAAARTDDWRTITVDLPPSESAGTVEVDIDRGTGGQPQKRHTLVFERESGQIVESRPFSALSPGRQARSWLRFLHTGEALGIVGQTIAGVASLAAVIMVWTGLALAYRRTRRAWIGRRARTAAA